MRTNMFDGPDYDPAKDEKRLTIGIARIIDLCSDAKWRTLHEISTITKVSEPSVSADLRHLRKLKYGSQVVRKKRMIGGIWAYQLIIAHPEYPNSLFGFNFKFDKIVEDAFDCMLYDEFVFDDNNGFPDVAIVEDIDKENKRVKIRFPNASKLYPQGHIEEFTYFGFIDQLSMTRNQVDHGC